MYELMWNVSSFADKSMWPTDGSKPFVYSMNLGGPAAHGDYVFGWEGDSLQKAMDNNCKENVACPKAGLTVQTPAVYNACKKQQQAVENVDGCEFIPSCSYTQSGNMSVDRLLTVYHYSGLQALPMGEPAIKA
jgi:hypothetical protein